VQNSSRRGALCRVHRPRRRTLNKRGDPLSIAQWARDRMIDAVSAITSAACVLSEIFCWGIESLSLGEDGSRRRGESGSRQRGDGYGEVGGRLWHDRQSNDSHRRSDPRRAQRNDARRAHGADSCRLHNGYWTVQPGAGLRRDDVRSRRCAQHHTFRCPGREPWPRGGISRHRRIGGGRSVAKFTTTSVAMVSIRN